jgi:hypothetical protein
MLRKDQFQFAVGMAEVCMQVAAPEVQAQVVLLFKLRVVQLGGVVT